MKIASNTALLTLVISGVFAAGAAVAAVTVHGIVANAPAHCQAFTPGPSNTIRNRVVGSENIGAAMNVACVYEKPYGSAATEVTYVEQWFSNNNASGTINVSCTILTGYQGGTNFILNKNVNVVVGTQSVISFSGADRAPPAPTLGDHLVGINCNLPTGAVINDTYMEWNQQDGVGV